MPIIDSPSPNFGLVEKLVKDAIEKETAAIVEEEAKEAAARVEKRVRGMLGQIATQIVSNVDFERFQNRLCISVRLPDRD